MDAHERRALPERWEECNLLKYISLVSTGVKPFNETRNYVDTGNLDTGKILGYQPVTFDSKPSRANLEARFNDVLFAKMKDTEKVFLISREDENNIFSTGFTVMRISNPNKILPKFLYYWLRDSNFQKKKNQECIGATQKAISANSFTKFNILLPPLDLQIEIALILEKAEETTRLRTQADELADRLLESVFLEMFGDPMKNPKGWEIRKIKDISEKFSDGPFGSNLKTEHYENKGVRVIRLQNIGIANFLDDDKAYISEKHFSTLQKHTCFPGDVLIGTMGEPNLRACIIPKSIELAVNKADCIQCRPNKNLATSEYICHLLNLPRTLDMASNMIHGETRSRISMGQLSTLCIPIPPLPLQQKFARIVEKIESMRLSQNQSKQQIEDLFSTLMQKAFRGEI